MRIFCTYCGAANTAGAACYACGTALPAPPPPPAPPSMPPPLIQWESPPVDAGTATGGYVTEAAAWPMASVPDARYTPPGSSVPPRNGHGPVGGYGIPQSPIPPSPVPPWPSPHPHGQLPYPGTHQPMPYPGVSQHMPYPSASQTPPYPGGSQPGQYPGPYGTPPPYYGASHAPPGYYPVPNYGALPLPFDRSLLADVGPRFGAYLLDTIVLAVPIFLGSLLVGATGSITMAMLWLLFVLFGPALYFIISWATRGQTLGYRAMGLQLVRADGTQPTVGAAVARYLGVMLCTTILLPGLLGVLWMLWDEKRQAWYDKMADTLVVRS